MRFVDCSDYASKSEPAIYIFAIKTSEGVTNVFPPWEKVVDNKIGAKASSPLRRYAENDFFLPAANWLLVKNIFARKSVNVDRYLCNKACKFIDLYRKIKIKKKYKIQPSMI